VGVKKVSEFSYISEKIAKAQFVEYPYKHLWIEDFLSKEHLSEILSDDQIHFEEQESKSKRRNVIVFMMKPCDRALDKYISREHTGTNYHVDTFKDPSFIGVIEK